MPIRFFTPKPFLAIFLAFLFFKNNANSQTIIDSSKVDITIEMTTDNGATLPETTIETFLKGDMTRIEVSSVNSITRVIVDKRNQLITTLIKSVGKSVGYVETQSSVDSSTKEILKQSKIQFNDDSKEISGFKCKSADFKLNMGGKVTLITVWYCPEFKFRSIVGLSVPGLDTLPGAPIQAITKLPQGINTVFTVNKITPDNTIDDKIFQVPKGYQILKKDEALKALRGG